MNFYSASVALLWLTAFRAGAAPAVSRRSHCQAGDRKDGARTRLRGDAAGGAPHGSRPRTG
jgi:hypothetical protein